MTHRSSENGVLTKSTTVWRSWDFYQEHLLGFYKDNGKLTFMRQYGLNSSYKILKGRHYYPIFIKPQKQEGNLEIIWEISGGTQVALSVKHQLLIAAQVMISWSWYWTPHQATCWVWALLRILALPITLSLSSACTRSHSLSLKKKRKRRYV